MAFKGNPHQQGIDAVKADDAARERAIKVGDIVTTTACAEAKLRGAITGRVIEAAGGLLHICTGPVSQTVSSADNFTALSAEDAQAWVQDQAVLALAADAARIVFEAIAGDHFHSRRGIARASRRHAELFEDIEQLAKDGHTKLNPTSRKLLLANAHGLLATLAKN